MAKPVFYDNPDGLRQRFGIRNTENNIASTKQSANGERVVELYIRGEDLADVAAAVDTRSVYIPSGAYIVSATLLVTELFVGATAVLDIGTQGLTGTLVDDDGLFAAVAVASLTAGADIAGAGAQVGTNITQGLRIEASYDTAAFTAGSAKIVVKYLEPPVQTA